MKHHLTLGRTSLNHQDDYKPEQSRQQVRPSHQHKQAFCPWKGVSRDLHMSNASVFAQPVRPTARIRWRLPQVGIQVYGYEQHPDLSGKPRDGVSPLTWGQQSSTRASLFLQTLTHASAAVQDFEPALHAGREQHEITGWVPLQPPNPTFHVGVCQRLLHVPGVPQQHVLVVAGDTSQIHMRTGSKADSVQQAQKKIRRDRVLFTAVNF